MTTTRRKNWLGTIATFLGCLGVIAAVLPTWILPLVSPPAPVDKVVVDTAHNIKNRLVAKAMGRAYQEPIRTTDWYKLLSVVAVTLGVGALIFSATSFVSHEPWRFAVAGATLGAGTILFQFSLMIAFALIGVLFVAVILNVIGVSP